jgi:hypothetical protein
VKADLDGEDVDLVHTTRPEEDEGRRHPPPGVPAKWTVRHRVGADPVRGNGEEATGEEEQLRWTPHHSTTASLSQE